ncbi:MAG: DUF1698 domain-containing protein [Pseudomonadota bacterium]
MRFIKQFGKSRDMPKAVGDITWFHSLAFDGQVTQGIKSPEILQSEADLFLGHDLAGKSVLDIGAWDGFFSFEAERRGAKTVLSTDYFCWDGPGWGTKDGYNLAHSALQSKCQSKSRDVFDLDPADLGTFDTVLFLGVLYHLKNPLEGFERAAAMSHDHIVVETVTAYNEIADPVLRYYPGETLGGDPTNFFAANTAALVAMLNEAGFPRVEIHPSSFLPDGSLAPSPAALKNGTLQEGLTRHAALAWRS